MYILSIVISLLEVFVVQTVAFFVLARLFKSRVHIARAALITFFCLITSNIAGLIVSALEEPLMNLLQLSALPTAWDVVTGILYGVVGTLALMFFARKSVSLSTKKLALLALSTVLITLACMFVIVLLIG